MAALTWDQTGERLYETGVSKGVLFVMDSNGSYGTGVPWNGLVSVSESPSGAEASPLYADNIKYLNLVSAEEFGCTIEAYTYPDEFAECDGSAALGTAAPGVFVGQQTRKQFGLAYVTNVGSDTDADYGEKIHIVYGCLAAPSEKAYSSINDSPEAITFSWEVTTTPVAVSGMKPTSLLIVDKVACGATDYGTIADELFGSDSGTSNLPLPDAILTLLGT